MFLGEAEILGISEKSLKFEGISMATWPLLWSDALSFQLTGEALSLIASARGLLWKQIYGDVTSTENVPLQLIRSQIQGDERP